MRWRALRPVGEPLPPIRHDLDPAHVLPEGYEAYFVQSGTAALALGLLVAKDRLGEKRKRVLLPAYGCPDLVAAVVYAGLEPVLVDMAPNEPFLNLVLLEARLDEDVIAVIPAHFLGLAERVEAVERLARKFGAIVIEDSAQRLPGAGGVGPVAELVVLSFGRGKPAGALGGGALLVRNRSFEDVNPHAWIEPLKKPLVPAGIKRLAYNFAIRPSPYAMVSQLPGPGLGETRYRPLHAIRNLDPKHRQVALSHLHQLSNSTPSRTCGLLLHKLTRRTGFHIVGVDTIDERGMGLTRLPLLFDSRALRDAAHKSLHESGLGSSVMYGKALQDVPKVPHLEVTASQCADDFADRLLTIPVHADVSNQDVDRIVSMISRCVAQQKVGSC